MTVCIEDIDSDTDKAGQLDSILMWNSWFVTCLAMLTWLVITVINVALPVLIGLGKI